jgi:hypothetical protein
VTRSQSPALLPSKGAGFSSQSKRRIIGSLFTARPASALYQSRTDGLSVVPHSIKGALAGVLTAAGVLTQLLKEGSQRVQFRAKGAPIPAFNRSIDIPRPCRAGKQRELRVGDTVVAEIVDPAGRIEDQVLRPGAHSRVPDAFWQADHIHAVLAGRRTALADINQAGEAGILPRRLLAMRTICRANSCWRESSLSGSKAWVFPWGRTEPAGDRRIAVARMEM